MMDRIKFESYFYTLDSQTKRQGRWRRGLKAERKKQPASFSPAT